MKTARVLLLVLFTAITISNQAQEKKNIYRIQIGFFNGDIMKGYLFALNDSSIEIIQGRKPGFNKTFSILDIKEISLRKRNSIRNSVLIGIGTGALVGGLIVYIPPDRDNESFFLDIYQELNVVEGAIVGSVAGGLFGLFTGIKYEKFPIDGNIYQYNILLNSMQ